MRQFSLAIGFCFSITLLACGASGSDGSPFSCDFNNGTSHYCNEQTCTGGASGSPTGCTQSGGTPGTACSHSGAVGGCETTAGTGAVVCMTTNWMYVGTASTLMSQCTQAGGTFVNP